MCDGGKDGTWGRGDRTETCCDAARASAPGSRARASCTAQKSQESKPNRARMDSRCPVCRHMMSIQSLPYMNGAFHPQPAQARGAAAPRLLDVEREAGIEESVNGSACDGASEDRWKEGNCVKECES